MNERIKTAREKRNQPSWWNPAGWWRRTDPDLPDDEDEGVPGEVEGNGNKRIPGNVPGPPPEQRVKPSNVVKTKDATAVRKGEGEKLTEAAVPPERVVTVQATKKER